MKSEITVKILCGRKECFGILREKFELIARWTQTSYYWTHLSIDRTVPYKRLLDNSVLVRDMNFGERMKEVWLIYKQKTLDKNGNVVAGSKTSCKVESAEGANKIFRAANLKNWVTMKAEQYIFKNSDLEFCVQDVDGLGLYLEIEQRGSMAKEPIEGMIVVAKSLGLPLGDDFVGVKLPYELYLKRRAGIGA